jgi:hypothetical protein
MCGRALSSKDRGGDGKEEGKEGAVKTILRLQIV